MKCKMLALSLTFAASIEGAYFRIFNLWNCVYVV